MNIIETNSNERWNQAKEMFEKIKPLLDEGYVYSRAVKTVLGIEVSGIWGKGWFKDIMEYGESQGYKRENYTGEKYGGRKKQKIKN